MKTVIDPFLFEEPTVTGDTFLAMTENIALSLVSVCSFPFRCCTTSHLLSYLCLSGQGVS
jgi:hypothetical protein